MISKSDIVEAIRVQRERLRKFQSFRRDLLLSLPPLVADYALIISGIRRCGKSTLLAQLSVDRYKPEEVLSLNFDTPLLYGFEFSDFRIVDEVIKEHEGCIALLFDEIQIVDGWEVYIRGKLDEGFYVGITGSNASMLSRELGTKLTGRHITKELFPFSYAEYCGFTGKTIGDSSLYDYLHRGGFPQYLQLDDQDVLTDLVNDIVYRDIAVRYNIRDDRSLKSLLAYLMGNVGNLVSATKLKQILGMKSTSTVSDYFSYFEQTYLINFVPKFSYSYKAQLLNPKKVYCVDNGVVFVTSSSFTRDEGRSAVVHPSVRHRPFGWYSGDGLQPVGRWYESRYSGREAARDVADPAAGTRHQPLHVRSLVGGASAASDVRGVLQERRVRGRNARLHPVEKRIN